MIQLLQTNSLKTAQTMLDIQQRSYKVEANLIGFQNLPPLFQTAKNIQKDHASYLAYFIQDSIVGFLSYETSNDQLEIHKMVVDPSFFRQGIASKLLDQLILENKETKTIIVSTGAKNTPAIDLYKKKGFILTHTTTIEDTLEIAHLKRAD